MSKFLIFLDKASDDKFLQTIREECALDREDQEVSDESQSDSEEEVKEPTANTKKPQRNQSKSLQRLIEEHRGGECKSDTACLMDYVKENIPLLDVNFGKDIPAFEKQLTKLYKIIAHMYPVTSTLRGIFVQYTALFKDFYVKRGENEKEGSHVTPVRKILKAEKGLVIEELQRKEAKLVHKLQNKFHEDYNDAARAIRDMYTFGMNESTPQAMIRLLLSLCGAGGMRRGEVLDPSIDFQSLKGYQAELEAQGKSTSELRIGIQETKTDNSFPVDRLKYEEEFGKDNTLVQFGTLKDRSQQVNRFLKEGDERFTENRTIIKPTVVLTAQEVVAGVTRFRYVNEITKENYKGRVKGPSRFGTRATKPEMKRYFPRSYALAEKNHYEFGSHFMRKLYGNISFDIYQDKLRQVTSKYCDRSIWMSNVLAHQGSLATSLSYANVVIKYNTPTEAFEMPPLEKIRDLMIKLESLEAFVKKDKKLVSADLKKIIENDPSEVFFLTEDGSERVSLNKRKKRNFIDEADADREILEHIEILKAKKIDPSNNNLKKLGFGRKVLIAFKSRHPEFKESKPVAPSTTATSTTSSASTTTSTTSTTSVSTTTAIVTHPKTATTTKSKKRNSDELDSKHAYPLEYKTKVIAPQPKSKAAKKEALIRDQRRFGSENVLEKPEDCEGTIEKNVHLGYKLDRDLCKE